MAELEELPTSILPLRMEEFVSGNVIPLRNVLEEKRRRTLENVIPLSAIELRQKSSNVRIPAGNAELDAMCGGGFVATRSSSGEDTLRPNGRRTDN